MKKTKFFVLSIAALMSVGACSGNGGNGGGNGKEYVDPEVKLKNIAKANMNIDFDEVTDTCMVNSQAKAYIDAMEEQEKTLDKPYHFSSLYGPDDYARMAAKADTDDSHSTYDAVDTGGVDVCQYLKNTDDSGYCKNYPIKLTWDDDGGSFDQATVKFWSTKDQSDVREVGVSINNGKVTAELPNLFRARKYRVQVFANGDVSNGFEFTTGDYPRTMSFGGIKNVRDIGGFVTSYGVRTNQGLIYRGYYIDDGNPSSHGKNYNEETQRVQEEVMQIGVELDLQKSSETGNRTVSALDSEDLPVEYKCLTLVSYENFLKQDSYKNLPEVMHYLANADKKHVYFHCWGGADRTGMLDFFVNAILGVSYTDLIEEFELTTQTNNKRCHMHNSSSAHYPKFMDAFINGYTENGVTWTFDPNATVNENCERWMTEIAKVDTEDIERIREIMLPGYASGKLQKDKLIPTYTPIGDWQSDDLAHWKVSDEDPNVKCNWARHTSGTTCTVCNHNSGGEGQGGGQQGGSETVDYTQLQTHVWSVTKTDNNSDGKQYEQLADAEGKAGVRILFSNYSPDSTGTVNKGKIDPVNDSSVYMTYRVKAPKAGTYQMIMNGRVSSASYTLAKRKLKVTINGASADVQGEDRDGGLKADGDNDFVAVPSIDLTGNEDVITVACCDNRIAFVESSYITFAEH